MEKSLSSMGYWVRGTFQRMNKRRCGSFSGFKKTEGEPFWLPFSSGGKDDFGIDSRYGTRLLLPV